MPKRGKKYRAACQEVEAGRLYPSKEAVKLAKKTAEAQANGSTLDSKKMTLNGGLNIIDAQHSSKTRHAEAEKLRRQESKKLRS